MSKRTWACPFRSGLPQNKSNDNAQITEVELESKTKQQEIILTGNNKHKICGTPHCKSGKRMKKENRVFFNSETDAIQNNFRPCGHCMKTTYRQWIYSVPD
jgi:methylphosphotriester-DNA--protein-cysteine methyltransferase